MSNILLSIIAVLMFARIVLQIWQGKRAVEKEYAAPSEVEKEYAAPSEVEKEYAAPSEVENCMTIVADHYVASTISDYAKRGWELVQVIDHCSGFGDSKHQLFFTRKKIKTYYDR